MINTKEEFDDKIRKLMADTNLTVWEIVGVLECAKLELVKLHSEEGQ